MSELDSITGLGTKLFSGMPAAPRGYLGPKETEPIRQELMGLQTKAEQAVGAEDINIEKAKREEKVKELESESSRKTEAAFGLRKLEEREALHKGRQELQNMAFVPTKDTAMDVAGLFSLTSVIGMAIGGLGKQHAQQAMFAMNGMLEGYQKGRSDLYKKQQIEFDKNFKAMGEKVKGLEKEYEDAIKLYQIDREAGDLAAKVALMKAESPVLKAMEQKQGKVATLNAIKQLSTSYDNGIKLRNDLQGKADVERRHVENMNQRERMAKEQMALRERLAKVAADAKVSAASKGTTLKPPAKITEGYIADTVLKADVEDIKKDLQNPTLIANLKKYQVEAFLTEEGKILNQLLAQDIPADLQKFLTKVRDMRNNYYLNISGKAVTGGEALRNYGVVPQPGDTADSMINKLDGMSSRINQNIMLKRQLFDLPELDLKAGMKLNLKPNDDYSVGSQSSYEVNKVYTDRSGKKAKYLGDDNWEELE